MKVNYNMLVDKKACLSGRKYFADRWTLVGEIDHTEILAKLDEEKDNNSYGTWLMKNFKLTGTNTTYEDDGKVYCKNEWVDGVRVKMSVPMVKIK
jgi:hypothetical protein